MFMRNVQWDGKTAQFIELIFDLIIIVIAYIISAILTSQEYTFLRLFQGDVVTQDFLITLVLLVLLSTLFFRVYKISITKKGYVSTMFNLGVSLGVTGLVLLFLSLLYVNYHMPRTAFGMMLIFQYTTFAIVKAMAYVVLKKINIKTAMVIGPEKEVAALVKKILYDDNRFITIKYIVNDAYKLSSLDYLITFIEHVDYVYITESIETTKKNRIIAHAHSMGKTLFLVPKLYELSINKAPVSQVGDALLYEINELKLTLEQRIFKRLFDLVLGVIMSLITLPITLIAALAIKLHDGGPVLFKQERITRNNQTFMLYKFRTMIVNAEAHTGPVLAKENDTRITKVGRVLRAMRIDELPQLYNILKGDMSIVGPRPERAYFIETFMKENKDYAFRLNVKAGVTGLAQALGTYNTSFNEKLRFDIYYITNYSILHDMTILLHTLRAIFDRKSAAGLSLDKSLQTCLEESGYMSFDTEHSFIKILVRK